jgi:hypothetical protein
MLTAWHLPTDWQGKMRGYESQVVRAVAKAGKPQYARIAPKYRHAADIPATVRGKISRSAGACFRSPSSFAIVGKVHRPIYPKARSIVLKPSSSAARGINVNLAVDLAVQMRGERDQ